MGVAAAAGGETVPSGRGRAFSWPSLLALGLLALMLLRALGRRQAAAPVPAPGQPLPSFELGLLGGGSFTAEDLRGKASFINFWASWCLPCREEMPLIQELYRREQGRLHVLAVNVQEGEVIVRRFLAETGLYLPVALDPYGKLFFGWGFQYLPTSVFSDAQGTVCRVQVGALTRPAMRAAAKEAMAGCSRRRERTDLSPQELRRLLDGGGVVLVNVHVPYEGEIPGTDLFIPYYAVRARARELPGRDAAIAVYCRSGRMSREAVQALAGLGYRRVYNLRGGFNAWREAGLPFVVKREEAGRR